MQHIQNPPVAAVVIRWIARVLTIISIGILLLFFIGEADFSQPVQLTSAEWIGKLFFPVGVVIGMIVGWWREGLGAGITVGSLLAFYVLDLLVTGTFPSGPFFVLFALPGILFGVSWLLGRQGAMRTAG
jgi:hypothetical protein